MAAKAVNVVFFPGKYYIVTFLELAEEDRDFFPGTGGFLEPAANFFMGAAAFLEPTEEDGDFFTGVLFSLAAKAGNVVLFIGTAAFLEPTEENGMSNAITEGTTFLHGMNDGNATKLRGTAIGSLCFCHTNGRKHLMLQ